MSFSLFLNDQLTFLQNHDMDITSKENSSHQEYNFIALMRTSVIIALVMLLKAHLKTLYSLSEEYAFSFILTYQSVLILTLVNVTSLSLARKAPLVTNLPQNVTTSLYLGAGFLLLPTHSTRRMTPNCRSPR
jgi:hypothetical protein